MGKKLQVVFWGGRGHVEPIAISKKHIYKNHNPYVMSFLFYILNATKTTTEIYHIKGLS